MHRTPSIPPSSLLLPAIAVALCGAMWGVFWIPLRWIGGQGVGGAWVSLIFNAVALLTPLPWLGRRAAWTGFRRQALNGILLGTAFSLYTVSLVMTDVIHAILLFYLTPVWSTLGGRIWLGQPLTRSRIAALVLGFAGMAAILGVGEGVPLPRNPGDWTALISGMLWAAGTLRSFVQPAAGIALPVFAFCAGGLISAAAILGSAAGLALPMAASGNFAATLPWIVVLALVFFVPPNFLVLWAAQRIDPGRVGILLMGEVVVGAISAALFSGEAYGAKEFIGTGLIVTAGLVEVFGRRRGAT
ncbi:MAG: DMT family transporter [Rhizobiales bacterium]|nr:DMT family transporter [Hyphomicrobiales bacterium]MBI3672446.1 DMT family transporter [Hyphomicrobiales bacterium]